MKNTVNFLTCSFTALGLASAAYATESAKAVSSQAAVPPSPTVVVSNEHPSRVVIGQETSKLLTMQRTAAAHRVRPIDGEQAARSYARYLKSFEHPIPEAFETGTEIKK